MSDKQITISEKTYTGIKDRFYQLKEYLKKDNINKETKKFIKEELDFFSKIIGNELSPYSYIYCLDFSNDNTDIQLDTFPIEDQDFDYIYFRQEGQNVYIDRKIVDNEDTIYSGTNRIYFSNPNRVEYYLDLVKNYKAESLKDSIDKLKTKIEFYKNLTVENIQK